MRKSTATKIRCSECGKANLRHKLVNYDVGNLIDMKQVFVEKLPALVCPECGAVSVPGGILEAITLHLAAEILQRSSLSPLEVRYLRKLIGDTQDEFAQRLGVSRITANRWETGSDYVTGPDAYAIRSHAFFRLRDRDVRTIDGVAAAFTSEHPAPRPKKQGYSIQGTLLTHA